MAGSGIGATLGRPRRIMVGIVCKLAGREEVRKVHKVEHLRDSRMAY
jgi:hypothetical protein